MTIPAPSPASSRSSRKASPEGATAEARFAAAISTSATPASHDQRSRVPIDAAAMVDSAMPKISAEAA
jgi:hypothetical protein